MTGDGDHGAQPAEQAEPAQPAWLTADHPGLLSRLMAAVRPEFRSDELVFDPQDPIFGGPLCRVDSCGRTGRYRGLCNAHAQRWKKVGRPEVEEFAATTDPTLRGHGALGACQAPGCRYGINGMGLCKSHWRSWRLAGKPTLNQWLRALPPADPAVPQPATCRIRSCDLWTHGDNPLCAAHALRSRRQGHPDLEEFVRAHQDFDDLHTADERINLRCLQPQLRLEMQYALQRRHEQGRIRTAPARVQLIAKFLATQEVTSLLDRTEQAWIQELSTYTKKSAKAERALLICARRQVEELAYGRGWDVEYPRDMWRLRNLGIDRGPSHLRFDRIPQPWLRQLAKRWIRWRLSSGRGAASTLSCLAAITCFAKFLAAPGIGVDRLGQIDRTILERYLAELHLTLAGTESHGRFIRGLNTFFQAIRQHGWDISLPTTAMFYPEDFPKPSQRLPRALPEYVMTQLERPDNLNQWANPTHRLVTVILMRCGLRLNDALRLPHECVVTDSDGAPYLRYFNHKMKREALVPIDEELQLQITDQQQRLLLRWPAGNPVLFPRTQTNPDGDMPTSITTYRTALKRWLASIDVRDKPGTTGRRVNITPHQWRHTLGTRLINRDVPQEVVRRILDHDSHHMTAHYARLSDATIRKHWEAARKVNAHGETVNLDPDGPLAEAAWAKQRVSRATQSLPNGYCGLPLVQTCPHANSCLTCPMFITTAEFLPQHQEHHRQTLQIISAAEARGQTRMVEMNQQVLHNLNKVIASLHDGNTDQPAAADAS